MNTKNIKKAIRKNRELVNKLILTDYQLEVIDFIESVEEVTSGDIVKWRECSMQSAQDVLSRLYTSGWLSKEEAKDPSGGIRFIYKVKKD